MSAEQHRGHPETTPTIPFHLEDTMDRRSAIKLLSSAGAAIGGIAALNAGASIYHLTEGFPTNQEIDQALEEHTQRTGQTSNDPEYQNFYNNLKEEQKDNHKNAALNAAISIPVATAGLGAAIGGAITLFRTRGARIDKQNR